MKSFLPASQDVFFKRGDPQDPRLGEIVSQKPTTGSAIAVLGYPDDEGIRRNGGRPGAAQGPHAIRRVLYKMTPARAGLQFEDVGDLTPEGTLEERHQTAGLAVLEILKGDKRSLSFGGGHDYGYADGWGFLKWCQQQKQKPIVINFDAHLDVRPLDRGLTSGTPFFRLLNEFSEFDFIELGIQAQCNSRAHREWALSKGARIIDLEDFLSSQKSLSDFFVEQTGDLLVKKRPAFLSVDIDAFAWPYAIGASQSWPLGLEPRDFFPLLDLLLKRLDVRSLGIYEVSPPLEFDSGTSKLAALIAHRFLHAE